MTGILLVDKPQQWTSHDVVARLRGVFGERRAGHSGTLDPMATGLLPVFFGKATRAVPFTEDDRKTYEARLRFGVRTDTQDIWGTVQQEQRPNFTAAELDAVLSRFRGNILQTPPMYSAVKVDGKRLYEIARKGGVAERKARPVTVFEMERGEVEGDELFLRVSVSRGTYIRTLIADIGDALGCGACMTQLRRTRIDRLSLDEAFSMEDILSAGKMAKSRILGTDILFEEYPAVVLSEKQKNRLLNGGDFSSVQAEGRCRAYDGDGRFVALAEVKEGKMRSLRLFYEDGA